MQPLSAKCIISARFFYDSNSKITQILLDSKFRTEPNYFSRPKLKGEDTHVNQGDCLRRRNNRTQSVSVCCQHGEGRRVYCKHRRGLFPAYARRRRDRAGTGRLVDGHVPQHETPDAADRCEQRRDQGRLFLLADAECADGGRKGRTSASVHQLDGYARRPSVQPLHEHRPEG